MVLAEDEDPIDRAEDREDVADERVAPRARLAASWRRRRESPTIVSRNSGRRRMRRRRPDRRPSTTRRGGTRHRSATGRDSRSPAASHRKTREDAVDHLAEEALPPRRQLELDGLRDCGHSTTYKSPRRTARRLDADTGERVELRAKSPPALSVSGIESVSLRPSSRIGAALTLAVRSSRSVARGLTGPATRHDSPPFRIRDERSHHTPRVQPAPWRGGGEPRPA